MYNIRLHCSFYVLARTQQLTIYDWHARKAMNLMCDCVNFSRLRLIELKKYARHKIVVNNLNAEGQELRGLFTSAFSFAFGLLRAKRGNFRLSELKAFAPIDGILENPLLYALYAKGPWTTKAKRKKLDYCMYCGTYKKGQKHIHKKRKIVLASSAWV